MLRYLARSAQIRREQLEGSTCQCGGSGPSVAEPTLFPVAPFVYRILMVCLSLAPKWLLLIHMRTGVTLTTLKGRFGTRPLTASHLHGPSCFKSIKSLVEAVRLPLSDSAYSKFSSDLELGTPLFFSRRHGRWTRASPTGHTSKRLCLKFCMRLGGFCPLILYVGIPQLTRHLHRSTILRKH